MILYKHADARFPFLWEVAAQPGARWHRAGDGPVHYLADTPAGAWAEFLRHEEITDPLDLTGITRALWAVAVDDAPGATPTLPADVVTGDRSTYGACQDEAARLRAIGATRLRVPSAALQAGQAGGQRVEGGTTAGPPADGEVHVLFGRRPDVTGWVVVDQGRPPASLLADVRHFGSIPAPSS